MMKICALLFLSIIQASNAYENCGQFTYCPDRGTEIGYCCGYNSNGVPLCCYYDSIWTLWYFWIGILFTFSLLTCCVAAACRKARRRAATRTTAATTVHVPAMTHTVAMTTSHDHGEHNNMAFQPLPPSYQQVQQMGLPPKYDIGNPAPYPHPTPYPHPPSNPAPYPVTSPAPMTSPGYPHGSDNTYMNLHE